MANRELLIDELQLGSDLDCLFLSCVWSSASTPGTFQFCYNFSFSNASWCIHARIVLCNNYDKVNCKLYTTDTIIEALLVLPYDDINTRTEERNDWFKG